MSEGFQQACKKDEVDEGGMKLVEVAEKLVIVFRIGEEYYCIDDVCTHDGGTLSDGELDGCQIECPRHGARFDIRNGEALTMPATQNTLAHAVKVVDDDVLVKLADV